MCVFLPVCLSISLSLCSACLFCLIVWFCFSVGICRVQWGGFNLFQIYNQRRSLWVLVTLSVFMHYKSRCFACRICRTQLSNPFMVRYHHHQQLGYPTQTQTEKNLHILCVFKLSRNFESTKSRPYRNSTSILLSMSVSLSVVHAQAHISAI